MNLVGKKEIIIKYVEDITFSTSYVDEISIIMSIQQKEIPPNLPLLFSCLSGGSAT